MIVAGLELTRTTRVAFLAQGLAGLGAGIIELAGLADDDGAGADEQDLLEIGAFGHAQNHQSAASEHGRFYAQVTIVE